MNATFEQPKHLTIVKYHRLVQAFWSLFLVWGFLLSGLLVFGLWQRATSGEAVSVWRWVAAVGVGPLMIGLIRLGLLLEKSRRRYLEFRGDRLFLTQRGAVAIRRLVEWSPSEDPIEPRYTRLQLVYRFGFGRKRWIMLLDNEAQISELRHALVSQVPQVRGPEHPERAN